MKKTIYFFTLLFFISHNCMLSMDLAHKYMRRHSSPRVRIKKKVYRHSPGTYKRNLSPRGSTLIITKESRRKSDGVITIKLSEKQQTLCQQTQQSNDNSNDQINKKLCNTK